MHICRLAFHRVGTDPWETCCHFIAYIFNRRFKHLDKHTDTHICMYLNTISPPTTKCNYLQSEVKEKRLNLTESKYSVITLHKLPEYLFNKWNYSLFYASKKCIRVIALQLIAFFALSLATTTPAWASILHIVMIFWQSPGVSSPNGMFIRAFKLSILQHNYYISMEILHCNRGKKKPYYMSSAKWSSSGSKAYLLVLLINTNNFWKLIMVLFSHNYNLLP